MSLETALIIFLVLILVILAISRFYGLSWLAAWIVALIIGYLVLITLQPIESVRGIVDETVASFLYLLVLVTVPAIILIYALYQALRDNPMI